MNIIVGIQIRYTLLRQLLLHTRMGIAAAWQQGKERLHRELRKMRSAKVARTATHFLQEWQTVILQ